VSDNTPSIKHIKYRVGVLVISQVHKVKEQTDLGEGGSEDDDFVDLAHLSEEVIDARSLNDVNVVRLRFNLDRDNIVGRG